jgi:membrane protein YdbS with pleckstrin-like domain
MVSDRLLFSSKIDLWLLLALLAAPVACILVLTEYRAALAGTFWWLGLILAVGLILPLWVLIATRYSMSDTALFVRCGPFSWTIPIAGITKIEPTRSPLSSPALSLDRLRIVYDGGSIMISPEPRKAFLQQLEHRRRQSTD